MSKPISREFLGPVWVLEGYLRFFESSSLLINRLDVLRSCLAICKYLELQWNSIKSANLRVIQSMKYFALPLFYLFFLMKWDRLFQVAEIINWAIMRFSILEKVIFYSPKCWVITYNSLVCFSKSCIPLRMSYVSFMLALMLLVQYLNWINTAGIVGYYCQQKIKKKS